MMFNTRCTASFLKFLTSKPNDRGLVIFLINIALISCNTNLKGDTMALKLEYIKGLQNIFKLPPCCVFLSSTWLIHLLLHAFKTLMEYAEIH